MTQEQKDQMNGFTNGSCAAYWGSIEWLNGATVTENLPCYCSKCQGDRRAVRVQWNGFHEHLLHVDPKHIH